MLDEEILDIIEHVPSSGDRLNELADEFRNGRPLDEFMNLLRSKNPELVAIGAWILGELSFELYSAPEYIQRLKELTDHEDPSVRFHALGALFPALDPNDGGTLALLEKLRGDRNEGVRRSAEAASARLSAK